VQPHNAAKARIGVVIHNRDRQPALYYAIITLEPLKKPSEEFMAWWLTLPGAYGFHSTLPMVAQIETGNSAEEVRRDARKILAEASNRLGYFIAIYETPLITDPPPRHYAFPAKRQTATQGWWLTGFMKLEPQHNVRQWHVWPAWLMNMLDWFRGLFRPIHRKTTRHIARLFQSNGL
jgi:hypothetical protein